MNSSSTGRAALASDEFIAEIWQERRRYVSDGKIKQPHSWRVALSEAEAMARYYGLPQAALLFLPCAQRRQ